jgi:hypothetical protein
VKNSVDMNDEKYHSIDSLFARVSEFDLIKSYDVNCGFIWS